MPNVEELVKELERLQPGHPRGDTLNTISRVSMNLFIGPAGAGKSTICDAITKEEPAQFSVPGGITTRENDRSGKDVKVYRHIPHDAEGLSDILRREKAGKLAQFAVHSTTGKIYGSEAIDYQTPYAVLDTMYHVVDDMREIPFKEVNSIVVVTPPDQHDYQLKKRYPRGSVDPEYDKRIEEGVNSLEWCTQRADELIWVRNYMGDLRRTALEAIGIIKGDVTPNPHNKKIGEQMLKNLITKLNA